MANLDENSLNIYTDGSQKNNPYRSGFAYRFVLINKDTGHEEPLDFYSGRYPTATNNQMELLACVEAIKTALKNPDLYTYLKESKRVVIYTDSDYIKKHYQIALYEWGSNDWMKAGGGSVLNISLWKELNKLRKKLYREAGKKLSFEKVRAHQGGIKKDLHNDAVDKLATKAANSNKIEESYLLKFVDVRRKGTTHSTIIGSVMLCGQILKIYIVTDQIIKNGLYRYKYRVVSSQSSDYGKLDYANSSLLLNAGHYYKVTFNDSQSNPMILESTEIDKDSI